MKKVLFLVCALAALASCKKDNGPEEEKYPQPEAGQAYVLEGTVSTDGFTWGTGSSVGIYSLTDGVKVSNEECKIVGWADVNAKDEEGNPIPYSPSQYDGQATARFNTPAMDLVAGKNRFLVYTPYDKELSYIPSLGTIYNLSIAENQTQSKAGIAGGCFSLGVAEAIPGKDEVFPFTLNPISALLKINVSSSEFVGYGLKKVTVCDESGASALGGSFDIVVEGLVAQTIKTISSVATTITAPQNFKSASDVQSIYMNILPGDYSSVDLLITVELTSEKGNVIIPLKKKGVKMEAGKTTEMDIKDLASSMNIYPWYCPVENRKLAGLGYAYGDANTYFIQCKSGVYTGAALSPVSDYPESVTIDYRLRGNIANATAPTNVSFEWATLPNGTPYIPRTAGYEASKVDPTAFTFEVNPANYTVTVKNTGAFAGSPILLMKDASSGEILWGWTFWNIAADGTKVTSVNVGNAKLANLAIGEATSDYDTWTKNANPDPVYRTVHYYQWGRYLPIFWTTYWSLGWTATAQGQEEAAGNGNVLAINGPFQTLKESLAHPAGAITHIGGDAMNVWCTEGYADLWGGEPGNTGRQNPSVKSVYDPCPKGWRVMDILAADEIASEFKIAENGENATFVETKGQVGIKSNAGTFLGYFGYVDFKMVTGATQRPTNYGNGNSGTWTSGFSVYWTSYCASKDANSPFNVRFYGSNYKATSLKNPGQGLRSNAAPVRCQVDENNR